MSKFKDNISNAFAASLSFGFEKESADVSFSHEDETIQKYAGINIYQPTLDNIEMFVRKYLMNELAFFPKIANVGTDVRPTKFNSNKKEYIDEATGVASVTIEDAKLEFPFLIVDGELVPFDVIQLGKQRVPYSRENLKKIVTGITNKKKDVSPVKEFEPYLGTDRPVNPTSSIGFLGDVLRIQEQYQGRANGGGIYITTSEDVDALLEKTANIHNLTDERLSAIENVIKEKVAEDEANKLMKEAEEFNNDENEEKVANLYSNLSNIQFLNAATLPHGTIVRFPEIHKNEITLTSGIIVNDYMDFAGWFPKSTKILITQDGRMKILESGDTLLCLKSTDSFKLPLSFLNEVSEHDVILAFDGNKAFYPCHIDWITKRYTKSEFEPSVLPGHTIESQHYSQVPGLVGADIYRIEPINYESKLMSLFADNGAPRDNDRVLNENVNLKLVPLTGAKFIELPYNEFIKRKAEELGLEEITTSSLLSLSDVCSYRSVNKHSGLQGTSVEYDKRNIVICTDPKTKVLVVKGIVTGYLKRPEDLANMVEYASEIELNKTASEKKDILTDSVFKTASQNEYIEIRIANKEDNLFDIKIMYADKTKKMFKQATRQFKSVYDGKLRGILKAIGFDIPKISEIINKVKRENYVRLELPNQATPERLVGGQIGNLTADKIKAIKGKMFDSNIADALAAEVIGQMMGGSISPSVVDRLKKFAEESEGLAISFEKIAVEKKDESALKVAKLMTIAHNFEEKVASIIADNERYPKMKEIVADIVGLREELEKTAHDLMALKAKQYITRNHEISPNYIQGAIVQLDNMYKVAATLHRHAGHDIDYGDIEKEAAENEEEKQKNAEIEKDKNNEVKPEDVEDKDEAEKAPNV